MASYIDLENELAHLNAEQARDESVRLHRLVEEIKALLRSSLPAEEKVAALRAKLGI